MHYRESFIPILKIQSKHSKWSKGKEDCIGFETCAEGRMESSTVGNLFFKI